MRSLRKSSGGMSPKRYAPVEVPRPGALRNGRSVRAAPPTTACCSRTRTARPARARSSAATRPLCPAPTTTTSARSFGIVRGYRPARWPVRTFALEVAHGRQAAGPEAGDRARRGEGDQELAAEAERRSGKGARVRGGGPPQRRADPRPGRQDAGQRRRLVHRAYRRETV